MSRSLLFCFVLIMLAGCGGSAAREVVNGNRAFDEGDYDRALVAYESAQELAPVQGEPIYNLANTRYRQGIYTDTVHVMPEAVAIGSETVEESGYFNLGNANFQLQEWAAAVEAYKETLRRNPSDLEAKYNLELAMRHLQNQEQNEQEQDPQDQEQQDQEQQDQEQQDQNQEEQENQSEQNQQDQSQQGQDQSQQDGETPEEENQEEQSQSAGEEGEEEQQNESNSADGEEEEDPSPNQAQQPQTIQPQQGLSQEQARQLLGAIGKNSETLQEHMQQIYVSPDSAPEKDW